VHREQQNKAAAAAVAKMFHVDEVNIGMNIEVIQSISHQSELA
jgi:hypothetical protein